MKIRLSMLSTLLLACSHLSTNASIIQVEADDFIAMQTESFEQFAVDQYHSGEQSIFNGTASIIGHVDDADTEFFIAQNGRWEGWSQDDRVIDLITNDGTQFLATHNDDYVSINFLGNINYFGGYFADVSQQVNENITFDFFNQQDQLIDSINVDNQTINGEMTWAGFYSNENIGKIRMSGFQNTMDGLRIGNQASISVPEPMTLSLLFAGFLLMLRRKNH